MQPPALAGAWNWDVEGLEVHVLGDLALLASEAGTCPRSDVSSSSSPDKPQQNEMFSGTYIWVRNVVQFFKDKLLKRIRNYWPENSCEDVS